MPLNSENIKVDDPYQVEIDLDNLPHAMKVIKADIAYYFNLREDLFTAISRHPEWNVGSVADMVCEAHDIEREFLDHYALCHKQAIQDDITAQVLPRQNKSKRKGQD